MHALVRAMEAIPGHTTSEYRVPGQRVVIRVVSHNCPACDAYKNANAKHFEKKHFAKSIILELSTHLPAVYNVATAAGVTKIPAYILLYPGADVQVKYPCDERPSSTR